MVRRSSTISILAILLVVGLAQTASAAVRIRAVNVASFPQVSVTISSDSDRVIAIGDLVVRENGHVVSVSRVTSVTPTTQRVDAVLAIDVSNSMRGSDLATALAAAKRFVGRVPDWLPVGVIAFARSTRIVSPITQDRSALSIAVDRIGTTTSRGTALYDAIRSATAMFSSRGQHNLIVLTDGRNTVPGASLSDSVAAANAAGVNVFTIGLDESHTDEASLRAIARATDGAYRSLSADDLGAAYASLAAQLGHQFVVTYRSKVPFGMPATVAVGLPGGTARANILMPAHQRPDRATSASRGSSVFEGDVGLVVVVVLTFLAVLFTASLVSRIGRKERRRRSLAERLLAAPPPEADAGSAGESAVVRRPIADAFERGATAAGASRSLSAMLTRAGWSLSVGEFLSPSLLVPVVLAGLLGMVTRPIAGFVGAVVLLPIPFVVLSRAARKRSGRIQAQLPDVLMILASSLRAGHSFLQALDSVAKEIADPGASEFARTLSEIRLGRHADEALDALAERVGGQDLEWAVTAINVQRKVGGNLAEVLETVAATIRERQTIRRQIRVLSAEGRLSVTILFVLPFLIGLYLAVVNPDYLSALTGTVAGMAMLMTSAVLMVVGLAWMRKVIRLDV